MGQTETVLQRLNYGVIFKEEADVRLGNEYWLHTFKLPMPKRLMVPMIGDCHKDNDTCLLIGQMLGQINMFRKDTALQLNNTILSIKRLVPEASIRKTRTKRALLSFVGQLSRTIFGTATVDDVEMLARHINKLTQKSFDITKALQQHGAHMSSYIAIANKRMDNLMQGIEENEQAISYVHSQIQRTFRNLEATFAHMNSLLLTQIEHSNHLNHELEELKLGILDLVMGKLSPLLIPSSVMQNTIHHIQKVIDAKYTGFHLSFESVQQIYDACPFLFTRNGSNIYITLKVPLSFHKRPMKLFRIISLPVPINTTSLHATHLPDLPQYFAISADEQFYTTMSQTELSTCTGKTSLSCNFNRALEPVTSDSCTLALFQGNKVSIHSKCDFRFIHNSIKPSIVEITPSSVLVYRTPIMSMECGKTQKMITGCDFCIMQLPCLCSLTSTRLFLHPRLTTCHHTNNITTLHPVNLILLQTFFDERTTEHLLADTTFPNPVNVSVPQFKLYEHKMDDILADDTKNHLSLKKMAEKAKQDEVIFKSLTEPLLEGMIPIPTSWPDLNGILILVALGIGIAFGILGLWAFRKIRKLSTAVLVLQKLQKAHGLPTHPSFIYSQVTDSVESVNSNIFDIELEWNHVTFVFNLIILLCLVIIIVKLVRKRNTENPYICLEISTAEQCLLLPIMKMPLCPSQCQIHVPHSITNMFICGSWYAPILSVSWPEFYISSSLTDKTMVVPESFPIPITTAWKLKTLLRKPFSVYLHATHNGLLMPVQGTLQATVSIS
ncbi:MAG: envelope fusion protein [Sedimenticola sp.]